jgi:alpha-tubulin suppressor-like RCC1 family protein
VTLSAAPDSRYRFAGWQGACSGVGVCQLSMDSFQSVSATFVAVLPTTLSASSLVFSMRTQGAGAPQSVIFTNTGATAVSITAINASGEFAQTNDCGESIAAGSSCMVVVNHTLALLGMRAGTLVIHSSATGSPHRVNLWSLQRLPALAAGYDHSIVIKSDGSLWAWGNNAAGELGDGTGIERDQPVAVAANMLAAAANAVERVGLVLREDGSLWAWGANEIGQLGDGTTTTRLAPVMIGTGYRSMAVGYGRSYGIKDDGSLWAWGANSIGQLGDGSTVNRLSPVPVGADFVAIAPYGISTAGIKTDGSLWALGASPHQIGTDFISLAGGGDHALALKSDGSLWAWGYNGYGQLGDGTTLGRELPVQVGSGFVAVSAGYSHSLALKGDGSLWAWGFNMYGQLGDGSTVNRASPVQVGTGYIAVAGGGYHTIASKSDGSIWAWGFNDSGQVGDGSTVHRSVPVQILGPGSNIVVADLTVTSGTHGGVRSVPAGIDCGATCSARFVAGTTIALTATPDSGYVFSGWSGACSGISTCVVALGSSKSVSANFVSVIPANVSLSNLAASFDGTQKSAECQTIPIGLATSLIYSDLGSGTGRSFAGSYGVSCTVTQFGYSGSSSGVMVIAAPGNVIHLVLGAGWNLGGSGTAAPIDVATAMGDATKVISVWKWLPVSRKWAFYSPTLASQSLADFAASRNYEVLSTIEGGEGFWVNAMAEMALPLPVASLIQSSDFMPAVSDPATPGGPRALPGGWSLIATGDKPTPSQFASALATTYSNPPTAGQVYLTLTTLWTWDASQGAWYFWAPNLVNNGGLTSYLAGKGYRDFTFRPSLPAGTISPTTGFWVNKP